MRISDWSSDVCSSDLPHDQIVDLLVHPDPQKNTLKNKVRCEGRGPVQTLELNSRPFHHPRSFRSLRLSACGRRSGQARVEKRSHPQPQSGNSEARRVGKECVSTCSFRWAQYLKKKKKQKHKK